MNIIFHCAAELGIRLIFASTPVIDVLDVEYNPSALAYVPPHAREKKDNCFSLLIGMTFHTILKR